MTNDKFIMTLNSKQSLVKVIGEEIIKRGGIWPNGYEKVKSLYNDIQKLLKWY
ncbi:hypothetical protein QMA89_00045 [Mycoplasma sp. M6921]|nr:hypothetical protein [Mycoplasma phocimorsus]